MTHPPDDVLFDRATEDPHLSSCAPCRDRRAQFIRFESALSKPNVWEPEEAPMRGAATRADVLDQLARAEREARSGSVVAARIASRPDDAEAILAEAPAEAGAMVPLLDLVHELLPRNPRLAFDVTMAVEKFCERIDWTAYPEIVRVESRGRLLRERANALRAMGSFEEGLKLVNEAKREYESLLVAEHPIAILDYVAATILREQGELDEALRLARSVARVFMQYGDEERYLRARILEGAVLGAAGRQRETRDLMLAILPAADGFPKLRGTVHANIGQMSVELQDLDLATTHLQQAMLIFRRSGMDREAVRVNWGLARILLRRGSTPEGLDRLVEIEASFLDLGMQVDAALAALDRLEAQIAAGTGRGLEEEAADLHRRFLNAGLQKEALAALAYLQDVRRNPREQARALTRVRSYFERLQREPELRFAELPEPS